ncbi:MAG: hypothetical protein V4573_08525 [Pseudomonadota bacterium]
MIAQNVKRIRRAVWTWRQPLTRLPALANASISDLFVWRSSQEWQTFFELIDIPSLFEDNSLPRHVTLVFFDGSGRRISEQKVDLKANYRQTLNISSIVGRAYGETGTFAVFHLKTPSSVTQLGSFIAERGYVSYRYRGAPLRAYVHGNLDAIARGAGGKLQLLGGGSFLRREYSLQHELQPGAVYELGMVNPTPAAQRCICKLISVSSGKIMGVQVVNLPPGGIQLVPVRADKSEPVRLVIQSHLVMARPLVFRIQNLKLDVFHG